MFNHKYSEIKPDFLVEGTVIDFDCYIKRYDDFVIIIESGTLILNQLLKQVNQHKVIYILKLEMNKVKNYNLLHNPQSVNTFENLSDDEIIAVALKLSDTVSDISTVEERLKRVYETSSLLMRYIFENSKKTLPTEALWICVTEIIRSVDVPINIMPLLLEILPEHYSTHHHSVNVAFFSAIIGKNTDIESTKLKSLAFAGLLHDIGKINIDNMILAKPDNLDDHEYERVKEHSHFGYLILEENKITDKDVLNGVLYHHEKLDGSGYPQGLRGKMIPKFARIIGMCDVFDALTTHRTYRQNYSSYEAFLLIKQQMREQFVELYTDTFIRLLSR